MALVFLILSGSLSLHPTIDHHELLEKTVFRGLLIEQEAQKVVFRQGGS